MPDLRVVSLLGLLGCGAVGQGEVGGSYTTVLIRDHEPPDPDAGEHTSGSDIDAVEIDAGGEALVATLVEDHGFGSGANAGNDDPDAALGAPDSGCEAGMPGFVSLAGADGGYLILSFDAEIRSGDTITVTECGHPERYDVLVGDGVDIHGMWSTCEDEAQGTTGCVVP